MEYRKKLIGHAAAIFICTLVPLGVSGAWRIVPAVSETVLCSAAREMGGRAVYAEEVSQVKVYPPHIGTTARDMEAAPEETETHLPEGSQIPTPLPPQEVLGAVPYPTGLTYGDGAIEKLNFGHYTGEQYFDLDGGGQVRNCTWHTNRELYETSRLGRVFDIETGSPEPQVLIYHTHTTEAFELEERDSYDSSFYGKTTEPDRNITAVGDEICRELEACGITVLHDTLVHDYPSYDAAYDSSRETVTELLEKYPSVKVALDIHRDGIETAEGVRLSPVAETESGEAAQIMIISGCDDGTMGMPDYLNNFRFACELQSKTETMYPGLTRPILFDYRFYNQDLTDGSLLIEVGSHGNTLEQAKLSGKLIGKALGSILAG